ncbi:RHS repeat-associated core domain-containing protein [Shewanella sp. VB17]|uniref:RHS repeat-associated core domain-containing protein n=1 Tax=Shewanella sp. VB17 TaxID=2739432 RepID=UPI001563D735|nr:RHS repeat-associated core domain-containing protein [Shewanella sp. VB17]NRD73995.1 RHS repeat-associated core domain-containing protein [Shewanella sp. VB17]
MNSSINASRRHFMKQSSLLIAASPLAGLSPVIASAAGQIVNVKVSASESSLAKNSLGFNGERQDSATGLYHLGKGYRVYNPALMRFHASDSMSPFGKGGVNAYAYCLGDPINLKDPSGHFALMSLLIGAIVGAVVGASISAAAEGIRAAATDTKFDWKQVGIGAALGFISGGFGAAAVGAKTGAQVGLAVADAVVSGAADFGLNVATGTDTKQAGINAGIGAVIGLATFGLGKGINKAGQSLSAVNRRIANVKNIGLSGRGATKAAKKWAPEGFGIAKDPRIDMHLNNGTFNGKPLYIHYTSKEGYEAISGSHYFRATPDYSRRGVKASNSVYLAQAKDAMSNEQAHLNLFLGEEKYSNSATHSFVFSFRDQQFLEPRAITLGSTISEVTYPGNIPFKKIDLIYSGVNPFT